MGENELRLPNGVTVRFRRGFNAWVKITDTGIDCQHDSGRRERFYFYDKHGSPLGAPAFDSRGAPDDLAGFDYHVDPDGLATTYA